MKHVVFVDDERRILEGLRRMLRPMRRHWCMDFAESGPEALGLLDDRSYDLVVSDMRMPRMDGREFLVRCRREHPQADRYVLSGHMEAEDALEAIRFAHQFLTKPCEASTIRNVLSRADDRRSRLPDAEFRIALGAIDTVPLPCDMFVEIERLLSDPNVDPARVAVAVRTQPLFVARLLQLVNSAFVGLPRPVLNVQEAIEAIGIRTLHHLVVDVGIVRVAAPTAARHFRFDDHGRHSVLVGKVARAVVDDPNRATEAFTAGLLHDVGRTLLAIHRPEAFDRCHEEALRTGRDTAAVEREILRFDHARVGSYLLELWGLPATVTEAVARHHDPDPPAQPADPVVDAVRGAEALVHDLLGPDSSYAPVRVRAVPPAEPARWESWRRIATQICDEEAAHA